jgi:hypothetical protein
MSQTPVAYKTPDKFSGDIVASASTSYRLKRLAMVLLLLAYGGWSIYDGFVSWPATNEAARQKGVEEKDLPHPGLDVPFNQVIGIMLPPLGILLGIWFLHGSRGEYRLSGDTLSVPGHPPVTFDMIRDIDKSNWDRKGIAVLSYSTPSGKTGRFRLDDFIYEQASTDAILERIEAAITPPTESSSTDSTTT